MQFRDAVALFEAKKYPEAYAMYEVLAKEWDSRAQVILGSALVHGSLIPRDIPLGVAWLRIAAGESNTSPETRARAAEQLLKYEPALSGVDLIRADAIAGELLAERGRQRDARVAAAFERLQQPGRAATDVKEGCALDPALRDCDLARGGPVSDGTGCVSTPLPDRWLGEDARSNVTRRYSMRYPKVAKRSGWEGRVAVAVHVDRSGWVCRATVADGSGVQALDTAALEGVRRWQFAPRLVEGHPVPYLYVVDVKFTLTDYVLK